VNLLMKLYLENKLFDFCLKKKLATKATNITAEICGEFSSISGD